MRGSKAKAQSRRGQAILVPLSFLVALSALALSGCNTMSGVGEDISAGGQAIDQSSENVQDELSGEEAGDDDYQAGRY